MIHIIKSIIKNRLGLIQYPSFITFFVTWRCNCKCIMCDIWKKEKGCELNLDEIKQIFSQLKCIDTIRISGGEPFLRKDLAEIINIIDTKVNPKIIHITSNGLLTNSIIKTLQNIKPIKKIHLKISIDGIGKEHDKIRGIPEVYDKAINTVEKLSKLRDKLNFYLGVNQTIVDEKGMRSYFKLKNLLEKFKVNIYLVIAYDKSVGLYSNSNKIISPENSYKTFVNFSKEELKKFISILLKDTSSLNNFEERIVKRYYLKGLYNRLIKNKNKPNPLCVTLNSHLSILPNGDIPVCVYNPTIVGNLKKDEFKNIWFSKKMKKHRLWVKHCRGCWAGCESNVNAIYSGDIWKY